MKFLQCLLYFAVFCFICALMGCADADDTRTLESITVKPGSKTVAEIYCFQLDSQPEQFAAVGNYSNNSTEDLTQEATWTDDSTTDTLLSTEYPGLVYFRRTGYVAIVAKYTEEGSEDEIKGMALIDISTNAVADADCK
ncbi:MAG: hypothetical protein GY866_30510 [Proteobacteria bacterium]|nr:hypothetical protein [Pseudomonadota bacterium]